MVLPLSSPSTPEPSVLADGRVFLATNPIRNSAGLVIGWHYKEWKGMTLTRG
jgi:hypothetical protein